MNWFTSMLSGKLDEKDVIKARPLNSTKITALATALAAGGVTATSRAAGEAGAANLSDDQQLVVWVVAASIVASLVIADAFARALASRPTGGPIASANDTATASTEVPPATVTGLQLRFQAGDRAEWATLDLAGVRNGRA